MTNATSQWWDFTHTITPYDRKVFLMQYVLARAGAMSHVGTIVGIVADATYALTTIELHLANKDAP